MACGEPENCLDGKTHPNTIRLLVEGPRNPGNGWQIRKAGSIRICRKRPGPRVGADGQRNKQMVKNDCVVVRPFLDGGRRVGEINVLSIEGGEGKSGGGGGK